MSAKKPSRQETLSLVSEIRPDDEIDPREIVRQEGPAKEIGRRSNSAGVLPKT